MDKRPTQHQLDAYLARVADAVQQMRSLNIEGEQGLHQALEESQNLIAVVAMYRHQLKHFAEHEATIPR